MMNSSVNRERSKALCPWLRQQRRKTKHHGLIASSSRRKDMSEVALELDKLPEDILHHIHSLVPLRDAARAACVSHKFLRSWRRFPNLTFSRNAFGLNMNMGTGDEIAKKLVDGIHNILGNHSGNGVKTLKLIVRGCGNFITNNHIDIWLQAAVKSGIVELALDLTEDHGPVYKFPCSLLSCAAGSLQSLSLSFCFFQPAMTIGSFRNLKSVCLVLVRIRNKELGCLFSCTLSLEKFELDQCHGITILKIPSHLQLFSILIVFRCRRLRLIEIYAPKITKFVLHGPPIKILAGNLSELKSITMNGMSYCSTFQYALTKLNSIAPNLEALTLSSSAEALNLPTSPEKFLHLRHLKISCFGIQFQDFDFLCLVSFLKACPILESFVLWKRYVPRQDSILKDPNANPLDLRRILEFHHGTIKKVTIIGFCSSKSLIELTRQILGSCSSLQRLVLDSTTGEICPSMRRNDVVEALEGIKAIERYIKGVVPSSVNLEVLEPCSRCHISQL